MVDLDEFGCLSQLQSSHKLRGIVSIQLLLFFTGRPARGRQNGVN